MAFTSGAATIGASTTALAASAGSVIKSFVLCVALGAVNGGVMSLAASETIARLDTKVQTPAQPGPKPAEVRTVAPSLPREPQFWPEALALRIEALRSSGQLGKARALAADFAEKYPHHPLLGRVQSIVAR